MSARLSRDVCRNKLSSYGAIEWHLEENSAQVFNYTTNHDSLPIDANYYRAVGSEPTRFFAFEDGRQQEKPPLDETNERPTQRHGFLKHKFRYVVCLLVIIGNTFHVYGNYTLYVASIRMVASDVLSSGLTSLRAKHLAMDPLSELTNAAASGTCPVLSGGPPQHSPEVGHLHQNLTLISELEQLGLALDTDKLVSEVRSRLASGRLVDWNMSQRGYIFTAHNIGSLLSAIPLSRLGLRFGSKLIVLLGVSSSALRALLLPTVAGLSPFWLVFLFELLMGFLGSGLQSVLYPLTAAWLLPEEAGAFIALVGVSNTLGAELTNFISTQMLDNRIEWPWCFYLPGAVLVLVSLAWLVLGVDRPEKSTLISIGELDVLRHSLINRTKQSANQEPQCHCHQLDCPARKEVRTPNWLAIFGCPSIWALILCQFTINWTTKISSLWPTYLANIVHLRPSTIGWITGSSGVFCLIYGSLFAHLTRKLAVNRPLGMRLSTYRKWGQVSASLTLALSTMLVSVFDCNLLANWMAMLLTQVRNSFHEISFSQVPLDLSPEDSGLVMSCIRSLGVGDSVALPVSSYVHSFASNSLIGDRSTWRVVWLLGLGLNLCSSLLFVLLVKVEPRNFSRTKLGGLCTTKLQLLELARPPIGQPAPVE